MFLDQMVQLIVSRVCYLLCTSYEVCIFMSHETRRGIYPLIINIVEAHILNLVADWWGISS